MTSTWQRVATVALALGAFVAAGLLPDVKDYLVNAGVGLVAWVIPHPADKAAL